MGPLTCLFRNREFKNNLQQRRRRLYRMAYAWCHDTALADDLTQETLFKALRHGAQLREPTALDKWLFRILNNCWRDHLRNHKRMESVDDVLLLDEITPVHHRERQRLVERVQQAVRELPEPQRQIVTLVDLEEFSYSQVAEIIDIPIGTVMSRLCRARKALADRLLEYKSEERPRASRLRRII